MVVQTDILDLFRLLCNNGSHLLYRIELSNIRSPKQSMRTIDIILHVLVEKDMIKHSSKQGVYVILEPIPDEWTGKELVTEYNKKDYNSRKKS